MSDVEKPISIDDERLEHAQSVRHDIVNTLIHDADGNRAIPQDDKMLNVIRGVLKDSDSAIFTKRRLTVEETSAAADKLAAETLSKMFDKNVPMRQGSGGTARATARAVGKDLPSFSVSEHISEPLGTPVDLEQVTRLGRATFKGEEDETLEASTKG